MRRAIRTSPALAVVGLAALVSAQGYFGGDQSVCSSPTEDFKYLGCFNQVAGASTNFPFAIGQYVPGVDPSTAVHDYDTGSKFNNTVVPYNCQKACRAHGFSHMALWNGACYCGLTPPTSNLVADNLCNHYCSVDQDQTCGGGTNNGPTAVYADPSFADPAVLTTAGRDTLRTFYKYLGCYSSPRFPTQDASNSEFCAADVDECLKACSDLRYPYAAAIWNDPTDQSSTCSPNFVGVKCSCGQEFGHLSYRVDETIAPNDGFCGSSCTDGTASSCDVTDGLQTCCGHSNIYPVYVNPELTGCYTPQIPGYGILTGNTLDGYTCAPDPDQTLIGGPNVEQLANYPGNDISTIAPIHPLSVKGMTEYFLYGCFPDYPANVLPASIGPTVVDDLEECATTCEGHAYFGVNGGQNCYCGDTVNGDTQENMETCRKRCAANNKENCGGDNAPIVYAISASWIQGLQYASISRTLTATPLATYSCEPAVAPTTSAAASSTVVAASSTVAAAASSTVVAASSTAAAASASASASNSGAPASNTGAPASNSGAPASNSGAPASNSGAPASNSGAPASNSGAPASNSGAPASNSGAPASNTGAPASNSGAPASNSGAPASNTGGAPASNSGGAPASNSGGAPASNTGGAPASNTEGAPASNTGGAPASNSGGAPASNTGDVAPTDTEVPPTETEAPPTDTSLPPTNTEVPPTETEAPPTDTGVPPTDTGLLPTDTGLPPTDTGVPPTDTGVPPTDTGVPPTDTGVPPTDTSVPPTDTGVPPTDTGVPPTDTGLPPINTGVPPTDTGVPPTDTGVPPTDTGVPPTDTGVPPTDTGSMGSQTEGPPATDTGAPTGTGITGSQTEGPTGSNTGAPTETGAPGSGSASETGTGATPTGTKSPLEDIPIVLGVVGPPAAAQTPILVAPGRVKRQATSGGFIGNAGPNNPADCGLATQFVLSDGMLSSGGQFVSTNPDVPFTVLAVGAEQGSITTEFVIVDGVLRWDNAAFFNGTAGFCQTEDGRVFATFAGPAIVPANCGPVGLRTFAATQCVDGVINTATSSAGATSTGAMGTGAMSTGATGTGLPGGNNATLSLPYGIYYTDMPPTNAADLACQTVVESWQPGETTLLPPF